MTLRASIMHLWQDRNSDWSGRVAATKRFKRNLRYSAFCAFTLAFAAACSEATVEPPACQQDSDCDDNNPCTEESCNGDRCVVSLVPAGAACGNSSSGLCDEPDTCNGFGSCQANNRPNTEECRPSEGTCDIAEFCDGMGSCPEDGFAEAGTSCGDPTDTTCNAADTCDGSGACLANLEPVTTVCRASQGECDEEEFCDGAGVCPEDALAAEGTACGSQDSGPCDEPDSCDGAGTCLTNNEPDTMVCRASTGECDAAEFCSAGVCPADTVADAGTPCGDATDTVCNAADTCDGGGVCQPNLLTTMTLCRASAGDCDVAEFCDGAGSCPADAVAAAGTTCGDASSGPCDAADTCDATGTCQANNAPSTEECRASTGECDIAEFCDGLGSCPADVFAAEGATCGDGTDTVCDAADTCDGSGTCAANVLPTTTECRAAAGECDAAEFCDGQGSCPADEAASEGTACGDPSRDTCTDPDTCDGAGTCQPNHQAVTTECRGAAGECDVPEFCDGQGSCPNDTFVEAGTSCGDGTDTVCNEADTCDGSGTCQVNVAPTTTECRSATGECDAAEFCDGSGNCPADVLAALGTPCGDPTSDTCTEPDSCDGQGSCAPNDQPSTTECRASSGQCDVAEFCDGAGSCPEDAVAAAGTACGDPSSGACDNADTCNDSGTCQANNAPPSTECRPSAGDCDAAEFCDGMGDCPPDLFAAEGTTCGDGSDTVCDGADSCDGSGSCLTNVSPPTTECRASASECDTAEFCDGAGGCPADAAAAEGTPCGDPTDGVCTEPDTCDGTGVCQPNHQSSTTECRGAAGECDVAELCDGSGTCPSDTFAAAGTSCGDETSTECNAADTCDGSGVCLINLEPATTECRAAAGECDAAEFCDGAGNCPNDSFASEGTPCGDGTDSICNAADTCDGSGTCLTNVEPATTECRETRGECDRAEFCDGAGNCPNDAFAPEGTSCGDPTDTLCDRSDSCDGSGDCSDNVEPITTECRASTDDCDAAEFCDGSGSCPANAFAPEGTACGDQSDDVCNGADTCNSSGACLGNEEPSTTECRAAANECDAVEFCDGSGNCPVDVAADAGTPCGDSDDTECTAPDSCDGSGTCAPNDEPITTLCRSAQTECDAEEFCDGAGNCPSDAFAVEGTICGDQNDDVCDRADTCDGVGSCDRNLASTTTPCREADAECDVVEFCDGAGTCPVDEFAPAGSACGDSSDTDCDDPDTCDGQGGCEPNFVSSSIVCRQAVNECDVADFCDGLGACELDAFALEGTSCGDPTRGDCDDPDTCDDSGNCDTNNLPTNVLCREAVTECDEDEFCDGRGSCPSDTFLSAGSPCGDGSSDDCDAPDTCDGNGDCQSNLSPPTQVCRPALDECDEAEFCDGSRTSCPADFFAFPGTPCNDQSSSECDAPDTCDGEGVCEENSLVQPIFFDGFVFQGSTRSESDCEGVADCPNITLDGTGSGDLRLTWFPPDPRTWAVFISQASSFDPFLAVFSDSGFAPDDQPCGDDSGSSLLPFVWFTPTCTQIADGSFLCESVDIVVDSAFESEGFFVLEIREFDPRISFGAPGAVSDVADSTGN
ncbi:MAG: hypothetical protein ACFB9M_00350 [Myxococcota bacterium]